MPPHAVSLTEKYAAAVQARRWRRSSGTSSDTRRNRSHRTNRGAQKSSWLSRSRCRTTPQPTDEAQPPVTGDPAELKTKFDALGTAIRAGVAPQSAAQVVGLDGIKFTGAVPVALRLPETQSADLEEK